MNPAETAEAAAHSEPYTLAQLLGYFLRLGTFGFGGPIALCGYMQRDLVERRRWVSPEDYKEGLALAQLAPGPLAAQLAIYLGWVRGRVRGATLVAFAFILPSFVMVLVLSALYVRWGGLSWMQGAFYGIGAAVIAIIARSAWKLVRMTLARDRLLWAIFLAAALITAWTESEIVWVFVGAGVVNLVLRTNQPARLSLGLAAHDALLPKLWVMNIAVFRSYVKVPAKQDRIRVLVEGFKKRLQTLHPFELEFILFRTNRLTVGDIDVDDIYSRKPSRQETGMRRLPRRLVNHPEVAILSIGRVAPRAVVRDGEIVVRRTGALAITFDHRVVDGARAAAFGLAVIARVQSG
jgi:chromate transport protein ChrA